MYIVVVNGYQYSYAFRYFAAAEGVAKTESEVKGVLATVYDETGHEVSSWINGQKRL